MWNELKNYVRLQFCKTSQQVANAVNAFLNNLTKEKCIKYINKLKEVSFLNWLINLIYITIHNLKKGYANCYR